MNNETLAIIAIALAFTLAAGLITIGTIGEPYHLAFAKKKPSSNSAVGIVAYTPKSAFA
jgi:hypothetical protein